MRPNYDFSRGERGRFFHRSAKLILPVRRIEAQLPIEFSPDVPETDPIDCELDETGRKNKPER